jgi:thiamine biosynthesis protein ThiC
MRAEESRKIAESYNNNATARELEAIFEKIEEQAKLGGDELMIFASLTKETIEFLKGSGYTITIEDTPRCGEFTKINW